MRLIIPIHLVCVTVFVPKLSKFFYETRCTTFLLLLFRFVSNSNVCIKTLIQYFHQVCRNLGNLEIQLTLSLPEKLKNSIFETAVIHQTLKINNQRTTSAKSINLDIIRDLTKYSLKNVLMKTMFTFTLFKILLSECNSALSSAQRGTRSKRI